LFTKELEEALLNETVDFAVHSFKDVPVTMPLVDQSDLVIAAVPQREDVRDVLASTSARTIHDLREGAKVGTGSLRRRCQLLARRHDLDVRPIRGNIDTRIRKLREGHFDAVVLAMAGLKRGGIFDPTEMNAISINEILPAAAQGALAIQCRREDEQTRQLLSVLNDPSTFECVAIERAIVQALDGDCHSPIAALATTDGSMIHIRAAVGAKDGDLPVIRADAQAKLADRKRAMDDVIRLLDHQGAMRLLHGQDEQTKPDRKCSSC
jgi:hydroxymethylbilane synthase